LGALTPGWPALGNRWHICIKSSENRSNRCGGTARSVANTRVGEYGSGELGRCMEALPLPLREKTPMAKAKPQEEYEDIPGTFVFNAERSRQGYGINMFCMSLMKDENRKAFKANEAEYLKKFNLTPEQTDAVLKRDYNRMLELGGNIYFTAKLGATDGHSFRHLAATMTGATQEDYAAMMLAGGRSVEGNRSKSGKYGSLAKKATAAKPQAKKAAAKSAKKSKSSSKRK
jgi:protocatechuate 4,5-dioxygenase alpha chain